MNKIFLSPEAVRDLTPLKQYISFELKNRSAANRIIGSILKDLQRLERYPQQGPSIEALTGFQTDLRMLVSGKHIALYRVEGKTVFISRVLDARQDYLRVLFGDDYWNQARDTDHRVQAAESLFGILSDVPASPDDQPNRETIAAMREAERIAKEPAVKGYSDPEELFHDLQD